MTMAQPIIFATNNAHKIIEIRELLGNEFELLSLKDIGFTEDIPEIQPTLEGNASDKAKYIVKRFGKPCFADDTGLEVAALDGAPGVYSARYAGTIAEYGSEMKRTEANITKLLTSLKPYPDKSARFRTVIAFIHKEKEYFFQGIVPGRIIDEKRGIDGFGYDPVFVPEGYDQTFAEMPLSEKNKISHRARAFAQFIDFLKEQHKKSRD
jgi:XTP/dITP diphosphohydrolase